MNIVNIEKMKSENFDVIINMVKKFYNSDAVSHNVSEKTLRKTLNDALSDSHLLDGYIFKEKEQIIGFAYVTFFYACEVGGECVMIEELFFDEKHRGKGYGNQFFSFLFKEYPKAKRFRLEVTQENEKAKKLYEKLGFTMLDYEQMVKDI